MTRKEFLKNFAAIGMGTPFLATLLSSCNKEVDFYDNFDVNFNGKILIIGAGSAGLTAGYILNRYNIDFQIIEASSVFGGRVKKIENFADFPIDLGGEWIHTDPSIFAKLLNDPTIEAEIEVIPYSPETLYLWNNNQLKKRNIFSNFYSEHKFKNSTWYDFFDKYIVPNINDRIIYNSPVNEIDYTDNKVVVKTNNDDIYEADKILVTVPLNILRNNSIRFLPDFPSNKITALGDVDMPDGIKVFIEFSERFYPDLIYDGGLGALLDDSEGEKIFYDAAFRKDSNKNILGLFTVGPQASVYTNMETEEEIINQVMSELDEMFDGKASETYLKHIIQNWTKEPYIQGSYSHYNDYSAMDILSQPLDNKVYFAGEALSSESQATVHGAAESAYAAIETILKY